jgi:hypothetical protein
MKALRVVVAGLLAIAASAVNAADDGSRTYANPSCSDRNANAADCVIQDGPPRRSAFGSATPASPTTPAAPAQPSGAAAQGKSSGGTSNGGK